MKPNAKIWIALAVLLIAGIGWLLWPRPKPPDDQWIKTILMEGERAVEAKDVQGCMMYISRDYQDDMGFRFDQLRFALAQAFRSEMKYDVAINEMQVEVQGDTAVAHLNLIVVSLRQGRETQTQTGSLTLTFAREKTRRYLFLPDTIWRVTRASNLEGWSGLAQ